MHTLPLPYFLRAARLLQSCHCLSGARIPSHLRNSSSRSGLVLLHETKPWTPASIPIRFLSHENSVSAEEKKSCLDQNHALSDVYGLLEKKTKPQSVGARPRHKSCIEVLDTFPSDLASLHELNTCILDLWTILAFKNNLKLADCNLITEHPHFLNLCYQVLKLAQFMSNKFLLSSLYVFGCLQVDQKTRLIRTLLNVCKERLSTMTVEEMYILNNGLKMMKSDTNVDILKSGLCLLTEVKYEEIKDVTTLQNLMRIAPAHFIQKYEETAFQMADSFTVSQCHNIFSVLAEINLRSERLLDSCSQKMIGGLHELSCDEITTLTHNCLTLTYINENLLSAIGDHIMSNLYIWGTLKISRVLTHMAFLRFRYLPLLDYFGDNIMHNSKSLSRQLFLSATKVYAFLNYLPEGKGDEFLETLHTNLHLHMHHMQKKTLLGVVYKLCILGLVSPPAIDKLLKAPSLKTLERSEKSQLNCIKFCLLLELGVCPFTTQDLEKIEKHHSHSVGVCHTLLKCYFKDPTLYQENIKFPNSYFIDFVLTLDREQGRLLPTGDMQNFESSQNITKIAILCCHADNFILGSLHPIGKIALKMRHLKSLGFTVVMVPIHHFLMLSEEKKVEFLRENISKDISSVQNRVEPNETE